ncbi:MAG: hypothetical protein E6951_00460 [Veillonella parvula]|nr:hypothetical protein [Veillonella parvula]
MLKAGNTLTFICIDEKPALSGGIRESTDGGLSLLSASEWY